MKINTTNMNLKSNKSIITLAATLVLGHLSAQTACAALFNPTIIDDFESYVVDSDINGQGTWSRFGGSSTSVQVSPTSGGYTQLAGAQGYLHASSAVTTTRAFSQDVNFVDGTTLGWRYWTETFSSSTEHEFGIMDGAGSGNVLAGIGATNSGGLNHFKLVGDGADTDTGIDMTSSPFNNMDVYFLEMVLNTTAGTFDAYATNETQAGARTFLGTKLINTAFTFTPGSTSVSNHALGGFKFGGNVFQIDDIQIAAPVPEPGTFAMLGIGIVILRGLRRRK